MVSLYTFAHPTPPYPHKFSVLHKVIWYVIGISFPNILISIKKFDYHLLISQIKRKNVVNRKEVRSEERDELTAKK